VLLVNPVSDGLNLVAKEGPILNLNDGVLALSREAGAWEELAAAALEITRSTWRHRRRARDRVDDVGRRAGRPRHRAPQAVEARTPRDWFDEQLAAARAGA